MTPQAMMDQTDVLACLERLIELARQKMAVLKERRHAALPAIVAAEEEVLYNLERIRASKSAEHDSDSCASAGRSASPQMFAQVAAAVAELQQLNGTNAALLQEHLIGVGMCLDILQSVATPTYSRGKAGREETVIRSVFDVRA